ncbi:MAG: rod shape-determining protein RodA [Candidatus Paceibacterota bacterium]|jgi:rod shape determining protein RodA
MKRSLSKAITSIDWILVGALIPLIVGGLVAMYSFTGSENFFSRQIIWVGVSFAVFFALSFVDFRFFRKTGPIVAVYLAAMMCLVAVLIVGSRIKGAKSWIDFGFFSFQPADFAKLALILVLAKYFSKRHVEIGNIRHILVSGLYVLIFFLLVMLQPDLGLGIIIFCIWFGMILMAGISKKHLFAVIAIGAITFAGLWVFVFKDYQKNRILTFLHPLSDIRGAGYNSYQSTIAVGSGQILGKGIGYGTQSRLNYLPEYETDFIFAAFAEEWGFVGVIFLVGSFSILIWRIIDNGMKGETNFEILYASGLAIMFIGHFIINVGMNMGMMPVTGIPLPFVSYGGSHLLVSFVGLGILMGMRRYARDAHKDAMKNEFLGI